MDLCVYTWARTCTMFCAPRVEIVIEISILLFVRKFQVDLVQTLVDGVQALINMEKALESGKSIEGLLPKGMK